VCHAATSHAFAVIGVKVGQLGKSNPMTKVASAKLSEGQ
jgi:hypothetical protein